MPTEVTSGAATEPEQDLSTARMRRRFARRQWARRWLSLRYVLAALLLVGLVVGGAWLVLGSSWLQVHQVDVSGNKLLSVGEVRRAAGVDTGEQVALVDLDRAADRVAALAPVKSAEVNRAWPDRIEVRIVERTPVAVVEIGGRLRGLDAEGVVFREYRRPPAGLPRVRPTTSTGTDALKEAATVVGALPDELARRVDHVEVETIDQVTLVLRDGRQVMWGSAEESAQKAEVLAVLLDEPGKVFDVSVPGSPTAR